ncbi:DNA glycosylase [Ephemerocybe angulata]|uniref:DNA glycosylase n=1 Tax=Ephemerocybe angulata TaxID=980116 RepID=A0A8H6IJW6_9AGAR|nr:DNA glycosylase [Tulosesus angulatus]
MQEPPQTPKKRKREPGILCLSPYFSPEKRQKSQVAGPNCKDEALLAIELESGEAAPSTDPLSLFYARSTTALYEGLKLLKPTLIQEQVAGDKWKVFVACTLLNKTSGKLALPVFWDMMRRWPTAWTMSQAKEEDLVNMLLRLGTYTIRARRLIALSREYIKDPPSLYDDRPSRPSTPVRSVKGKQFARYPATPVSHLPGAGPYALDSYRIFCTLADDPFSTEWKRVLPSDKELIKYLVS